MMEKASLPLIHSGDSCLKSRLPRQDLKTVSIPLSLLRRISHMSGLGDSLKQGFSTGVPRDVARGSARDRD
jgi:hypothetical protein